MIDLSEKQVQDVLRVLLRAGYPTHVNNPESWPFVVGQALLVRGVPLYYVGKVVRWTDRVLVLSKASWVLDTGNFEQIWVDPSGSRLRAYPQDREVFVNLDGISDWCEWPHPL